MWWLMACATGSPDIGSTLAGDEVQLTVTATDMPKITDIAFQNGRMVVTTQTGGLFWVEDGKTHRWRTIDVIAGSERGLLGIAFTPDYATSGEVALSWTEAETERTMSRIGIWKTEPGSRPGEKKLKLDRLLFEVEQPWSNHNGGGIAFGPDGMLYVGFGDGGKAGDPLGAGQDGSTALGAMLRLDPRLPHPHVPPDNPFVGNPDVLDVIWAIGLRNPWRFGFAPDGRIVAGDVGQNKWEELTFVPRGANLGWKVKEGTACYKRESCEGDFFDPFWTYPRGQGTSVTGGYVATSGRFAGKYVYGDFGSGRIWATPLPETGKSVSKVEELGNFDAHWSTFGRDAEGRVYVGDFVNGIVYRLD